MIPDRVDITLRRNAPFVEEWSFADAKGSPIDLTGWSGELQLRLYGAAAGDALVALATVPADIEGLRFLADDPTVVRVEIAEATIAPLPAGAEAGDVAVFVYDLVLIDPTGFRQPFREGSAIVLPGVSV